MKTLFYERTAYKLSAEPVPDCFLQLDAVFDLHIHERTEIAVHPRVLLAESVCGRMADVEMYAFLMEDARVRKSLDRGEDERTALITRSLVLGFLNACRGLLDSGAVTLAWLNELPLGRPERTFANQDFWHQLILHAPAVHRRYHPMRLFFAEISRWQQETVYRIPPLLALHAHYGHMPGRDVLLRVVDDNIEDLEFLAQEPYAAQWIDPLHLYQRWQPQLLALCEKVCHDLAQGI